MPVATTEVNDAGMVEEKFAPAMPWAMICSVPAVDLSNQLAQLRKFGCWLMKKVSAQAETLGLMHVFNEEPTVVLHVTPGSLHGNEVAYSSLQLHPDVIFVLHILPSKNSCEYSWMKSLSQRFGLIRQGVLLENALSYFSEVETDMPNVLANIAQWIDRRLSELSCSKQDSDRAFTLKVTIKQQQLLGGAGDTGKTTVIGEGQPYRRATLADIERNATTVLHERASHGDSYFASALQLEVSGFPASFTKWQVGGLFSNFSVTSVVLRGENQATVELGSKFQVVQAAELMNDLIIDSKHQLSLHPVHEENKRQLVR